MDPVTMRVDGLEIQVPKQWAQVLEKALKQRDDSLGQLTAARDTLQGKLDATTAELVAVKTKLAEAEDPKRVDAAVNARAQLLDKARKVLPADHKFDGLTQRQVHEAVLKKLDDKLDLSGRSDEYVLARFDHATEMPSSGRNDALDRSRTVTTSLPREPAHRQDAEPYVADWQKPLSVSKDRRN